MFWKDLMPGLFFGHFNKWNNIMTIYQKMYKKIKISVKIQQNFPKKSVSWLIQYIWTTILFLPSIITFCYCFSELPIISIFYVSFYFMANIFTPQANTGLFFHRFSGNHWNWNFRNLEFREKILEFSGKNPWV